MKRLPTDFWRLPAIRDIVFAVFMAGLGVELFRKAFLAGFVTHANRVGVVVSTRRVHHVTQNQLSKVRICYGSYFGRDDTADGGW